MLLMLLVLVGDQDIAEGGEETSTPMRLCTLKLQRKQGVPEEINWQWMECRKKKASGPGYSTSFAWS